MGIKPGCMGKRSRRDGRFDAVMSIPGMKNEGLQKEGISPAADADAGIARTRDGKPRNGFLVDEPKKVWRRSIVEVWAR